MKMCTALTIYSCFVVGSTFIFDFLKHQMLYFVVVECRHICAAVRRLNLYGKVYLSLQKPKLTAALT